jgi:hypothetical protein
MTELKDREVYMEEYKILVNILLQDEILFWRRSEVFIVINGGLLTILGLLRPKEVLTNSSLNSIPAVISIVGVLLCLLWFFIVKRSEAFYDHWYEHLKYLEKTYLQPMDIYTTADEYFTNRKIKFGDKTIKLDFISSRMRMTQALQIASLIFAAIWIVMGIYIILS